MASEALNSAVKAMTNPDSKALFDVTIICTSDDHQADYWMKRLSEGICKKSSSLPLKRKSEEDGENGNTTPTNFPLVLAVSEDWSKGGAGNGLGTLYAFQKACLVAKKKFQIDLAQLLNEKKVSAGLYHTAGKGTRLAPLPASENNNKPGVKLPVCHELADGTFAPITVLEAVVKQTGVYASSRKGRLSVFWGDQIFIPSAPFTYTPTHHADIMCTLLGDKAPTAQEWAEKGLDKYGVIAVSSGPGKNAAQVEKVSHETATKMLKVLGDIGQVGPSLGSFSVSSELLQALIAEYDSELKAKEGKFDTDPHFWMPMTLPEEDYITLMSQKGVDAAVSKTHHERMTKMISSFDLGEMGLFGAVDVGNDACWWDYGLVKLYSQNNLKFLDIDASSDLLREFFGVNSKQMECTIGDKVTVDEKSVISSSKIKSGTISNSVIAGVEAVDVSFDGAIVVNCTAKKITAGKNAILYNLVSDSEEGIVAGEGDIIVSVADESGNMQELRSKHSICGGKAWKEIVAGNSLTFEQMHAKNFDSNISAIENKRKELYKKVSSSFSEV